ncbi:hypothetical protein FNE76_06595, partial [Helicobacter mehlei]
MATLDFEKLAQQGVQPKEVLDFLKGKEHNFNLDALEKYYKDNGLDSEQITRALYHDLSTMSGFSFVSPKQSVKELATPLFAPSEQIIEPPTHSSPTTPQAPLATSTPQEPNTTGVKKSPQEALEELQKKATQLQEQDPNFLTQGALGTLESLTGFSTRQQSQRQANYGQLVNEAIEHKIPYEKLPPNVQKFLIEQHLANSSVSDALFNPLEWLNPNKGALEYNKEITRQSILKVKDAKDLSDAQKKQIYKDRNVFRTLWNSTFSSPNEDLKAYQEDQRAKYLGKQAARDLLYFKNTDPQHSLFKLIFSSDPKEQEKSRQAVVNIIKAAGFEDALFKEGNTYGIKQGQAYKIQEGFFENFSQFVLSNAGSLAGSLAGASAGFSKTRNFLGATTGGAIGAFLGGSLDYALSNYVTNREGNFKDMLHYMTEQGVLSLVGDAVFKGVAKGAQSLKPLAGVLGRSVDYIPLVGA